jgi:hypothetical protein
MLNSPHPFRVSEGAAGWRLTIITTEEDIKMERNATIHEIKSALQRRSGKTWSVTGGRGTAYGWITIDAPPARRTSHCQLKAGAYSSRPEDYEHVDTGQPGGCMTEADRHELKRLLGDDDMYNIGLQGVSIPASNDYYQEYIDRANGRIPSKIATPYWD